MSITQLNFSITKYYPNTFDFDGYIFHFISDDTKYNDIIDYQERNTITDQIEIKTQTIESFFANEPFEPNPVPNNQIGYDDIFKNDQPSQNTANTGNVNLLDL